MQLRIVRGRVLPGREDDFGAVCRRQIAIGGRSPGLLGFFPGYRRAERSESFVLATTWASAADAARTVGAQGRLGAKRVLAEVAQIDSIDEYELIGPASHGIVDAPGGIIRIGTGRVRPDLRERMHEWIAQAAGRVGRQQLLLGWAVGERQIEGKLEVVAVSAWPSRLVIEAVAEPGREGTSLFAAIDEYVSDTCIEEFRALALELPDEMADVGARRVIAARFGEIDGAQAAGAALAGLTSVAADGPRVAPLGAPGTASDVTSHVLVARVGLADYGAAERIIADHGGEIIHTARESEPEPKVEVATEALGATLNESLATSG